MKQVKFLLLAAFVTMFTGCQNEEIMEQDSEKDKPVPTGDTRIIIEGEGMLETSTRSSDGRVDFTGGYATGAGLYNGTAEPTVAAYPNAGYEVSYFTVVQQVNLKDMIMHKINHLHSESL